MPPPLVHHFATAPLHPSYQPYPNITRLASEENSGEIGRSPAPRHNGLHPAGRDLGDNVVLTIRRLSMGSGFKYLMDSIAVGDGKPDQTSNLTRYYVESGTPPGVFLGAGLADLAGGNGIEIGSQVSEEQLQNMLGLIVDPVSGEPLGTAPKRKPASVATRIEDRFARLPAALSDEERAAELSRIEAEEQSRECKQAAPAAGFDLTFSPSKSVSVAWALADQGTKAIIYEYHRRAIEYTIAYAERNVFHSRSGKDGVVQEDVSGVVAAAFTHYDSRSGDPQLHDHVVVWNRAKSVSDGRWRTLDSRGLFRQVVTLGVMGVGVAWGTVTRLLSGGVVLDYTGRCLNLAARLLDKARP